MNALEEMTLQELWQLFPISLCEHQREWQCWYEEEAQALNHRLQGNILRIAHIGSTAIPTIWAKPIIDILLEIPPLQMKPVRDILCHEGYRCMSENEQRVSLNKGYMENGFAQKVFHLHLRYPNDHDELYFRDYLREFYDVAKEYEAIKLALWKKYEHDRDAYTEGKSAFVKRITALAKEYYKNGYEIKEARR